MHEQFANAGTTKGLEVWRVENFEPVAYPKNDFGKFYTGDSYIILNTKEDKKGQFSWDVHFWLGLETSQDEAGAAAIMTVELDDKLGGAPIQHREVQEHESPLFLSYFKNGVRYMPGGVASGFTHVETNANGEKRLFQVKGKKNIRVKLVEPSISSMNQGDCFILDNGGTIYVYVGKNSKRLEKIKATSAANQIRDQDHHGRARVNIIDEFSSQTDVEGFFEALGSGSAAAIPEEAAGGDDQEFERSEEQAIKLYRIQDSSSEPVLVAQRPLRQEMLDTNDCFILDAGSAGIFVWIGKRSSPGEKSKAMSKGQAFLASHKYPVWTQVHRVVDGAETTAFKQYFATWRDQGMTHTRLIRSAALIDSDQSDSEFEPAAWHALRRSKARAVGFMPDKHADGKVEILLVRPGHVSERSEDDASLFYANDCYIVKYAYSTGNVIYYWIGEKSDSITRDALDEQVVAIDDDLGNTAVRVRVPQGHEPRHLLKLLKGKMITFKKGSAGEPIKDATQLFRARGSADAGEGRAEEVDLEASSLCSDDAFLLTRPGYTALWFGKGASDDEKEMARYVASRVGGGVIEVIEEGSETQEFWELLGGKSSYNTEIDPPGAPIIDPRLFHCRILSNGRLRVEEVDDYDQSDLDGDDVMILDAGDEIYIWIGSRTTEEEKERSIAMAKKYLKTDPTERTQENTCLVTVHQGSEPKNFKTLFEDWNNNLWDSQPSFEEIKQEIYEANHLLE
ncbi:gelsolin isoform X2 [Ctenocephalides felis]|nr:gelsolin isoform X2 [Ctenocephalides felis]